MLACFPGGGAKYGAHYDGGNDPRCKLTAICYANPDWRPEDGGQLLMLDERGGASRCWRSVEPIAGRVVFFRSEIILHKVSPSFSKRFATTCFWFTPGPNAMHVPNGIVLIPTRDDTDQMIEQRRLVHFSDCKADAVSLIRS